MATLTVPASAGDAPVTNTGDVYLNGDSFTFSAPYRLDDSPFLSNFPRFLTPGQSFTGTLFDIAVPVDSSMGTFSGSFQLLGGGMPNDQSLLGSTNFSVTVATIPEPASLFLSSVAMLIMVAMCSPPATNCCEAP